MKKNLVVERELCNMKSRSSKVRFVCGIALLAACLLKFSRNIDIIKGVAHGSIPTVASLARRAIGRTFEEFVTNLYMPEEMLRNRDKYERTLYPGEKERVPGNGEIEEFRDFILELLRSKSDLFYFFHDTIASNRKEDIREALRHTRNHELIRWFERYLSST